MSHQKTIWDLDQTHRQVISGETMRWWVRAFVFSVEILNTLFMFWNDYTSSLFLNLSLQSRWESTRFLALLDHSMFRFLWDEFLHWPMYQAACFHTAGKIVWKMRPSFSTSPLSIENSQVTENLGPLHSTQERTSHSFCQRRPEAEETPYVFSSVSLFRGVSGIYDPSLHGLSVKCFTNKNLQLQDLSKEWEEVWGRYNILKKKLVCWEPLLIV